MFILLSLTVTLRMQEMKGSITALMDELALCSG